MSVSSNDSFQSFESLGEELNPEVLGKIFMRLVDANNTSNAYYVVSGTGTGKSTLIPPFFLNFKAQDTDGKKRNIKIVVTVPTRIAVRSLYNTILATASVKDRDGNSLITPQSIGYAAEGEIVNEDADLRYVTTEHFLRKILRFRSRSDKRKHQLCDILIVDEVHTGTIANEIILQTWKKIRDEDQGNCPRLLLASANSVDVPIENVPRGEVSTRTNHTIEVRYEDRLYDLAKNELYRRAGEVAADYVMRKGPELGNVLVFLPGRAEIEMAKLSFEARRIPGTYTIPVEGNVSRRRAREMNGEDNASGKQLVIFATNAAETSLTIKNLGLVVDTLTEKIMYCASDESPILSTQYISKASSLQRRGRTGRTRNGYYHALTTEKGYKNLNENRESEITRVPLSQYILLLIRSKQDAREILKRAGNKSLDASFRLLVEISAIAAKPDDRYELTEKGKFCSSLPVTVRTSAFVYNLFRRLKQQRESLFRSQRDEEDEINVVVALTVAAIIENFDSSYYIYAEGVDRNDFFVDHFEQFVRDGSENSLSGRLAAWNLVIQETLASFPADRNIEKNELVDMLVRRSEQLHLAPYVNRGILRTYLFLREKAYESGVSRSILQPLIPGEYIQDSINNLLCDSFPRYQRGQEGYSYYLVGSEGLKNYTCKQRGGYPHETIIALSTIRIKIGEVYSDKISLYEATSSVGLRDNSARARRRLRDVIHPNESGEKVAAPETVMSFDEIFGFSDTPDTSFKRKKKEKIDLDYLTYVDSLLLDVPSKSMVRPSSKDAVRDMRLSCLPARYEDIALREDERESRLLESQLNLLRDMHGRKKTIVVLDPSIMKTKELVLMEGVAFTSPHAEDIYLGSIGRKEDLPVREKYVFILTRYPTREMITYLLERKCIVYSIVPVEHYAVEEHEKLRLYPFVGVTDEKEEEATAASSSSSKRSKKKKTASTRAPVKTTPAPVAPVKATPLRAPIDLSSQGDEDVASRPKKKAARRKPKSDPAEIVTSGTSDVGNLADPFNVNITSGADTESLLPEPSTETNFEFKLPESEVDPQEQTEIE